MSARGSAVRSDRSASEVSTGPRGQRGSKKLSTIQPPEAKARGAVFTRAWMVDMILDLAGYVPEHDLAAKVAIEPACGDGAFVAAMVRRLLDSCGRHGTSVLMARGSLRAYDIDPTAVRASRAAVRKLHAESAKRWARVYRALAK
jgi:adenine-specific DNA-methyltransferase